jgi:hypothetical protein
MPRCTGVIGSRARRQADLGGDEHFVATAFYCAAQDLFGRSARVDIGAVEEIGAGLEADVDEPARFLDAALTPGGPEPRDPTCRDFDIALLLLLVVAWPLAAMTTGPGSR